ncbi:glycosyltransferase [Paraclostridium bifermentans]|uniref:glycosyltransferase n=1 Tax=Paraclostridium bifermentans TaxID=1490 RepID=UPI00359C1EEE
MSIVFLVPYVPIPRMIKRINTAYEIDETSVIYWNRGTEVMENMKLPQDVKKYEIYQKSNEGKPLKRVGATLKFCKEAFSILKKENPSCIHVTKTDMLFLVWIYCIIKKNKPKVIYEVSDLHGFALNASKNPLKIILRNVLKIIEKIGCKVIDKLIVTSESFWSVYYKNWIKKEDVIFLPNTPQEEVFKEYKKKNDGKFTIGFIGKVRYKEQIKMMIDVANDCNINVFIAGNGVDLDEIKDYSQNMSNVEIYGAYNYSEEIAKLYGKVDCIYSVYDTNVSNVNIALPNRLYEAAICNIPIIAARGTKLGNIIKSENLGIVVEDSNMKELKEAIEILKNKSYIDGEKFYNKWKYNVVNENLKKAYSSLS